MARWQTHRCAFVLIGLVLIAWASVGPGISAEEAQPRTGSFTLRFDEPSPLSALDRMRARIPMQIEGSGHNYELADESFAVHVPEDYNGSVPYGLFVFINSVKGGEAKKGYATALAANRMIWIGAEDSGNKREPKNVRPALALDAVHNMAQRYRIDANRIYIGGLSGGGTIAALCYVNYPDVFTGGMPMCAPGPYFRSSFRGRVINSSGVDHYATFEEPAAPLYALLRERSRIAVFTGSRDFNRETAEDAVELMTRDGIAATLLQAPDHGHQHAPVDWFAKGLVALDAPLVQAAMSAAQRGQEAEAAGDLLEAVVAYRQVVAYSRDAAAVAQAETRIAELSPRVDALSQAAWEEIAGLSGSRLRRELRAYLEQWSETAGGALARQRLEQEACEELAELVDMRSSSRKRRELQEFCEEWTGTQAVDQARAELEKLAAPELAEALASDSPRRQAKKLQDVIEDFPGTDAAAEAQRVLAELIRQHRR